MEYIALEEAFDIPELAARRSAPPGAGMRFRRSFLTEVLPRLTDFTQYRLPDMDAHNVAVQVVSLTVPGIQDPGLSSQQAGPGRPPGSKNRRLAPRFDVENDEEELTMKARRERAG
jgi:hypothetical protein